MTKITNKLEKTRKDYLQTIKITNRLQRLLKDQKRLQKNYRKPDIDYKVY